MPDDRPGISWGRFVIIAVAGAIVAFALGFWGATWYTAIVLAVIVALVVFATVGR